MTTESARPTNSAEKSSVNNMRLQHEIDGLNRRLQGLVPNRQEGSEESFNVNAVDLTVSDSILPTLGLDPSETYVAGVEIKPGEIVELGDDSEERVTISRNQSEITIEIPSRGGQYRFTTIGMGVVESTEVMQKVVENHSTVGAPRDETPRSYLVPAWSRFMTARDIKDVANIVNLAEEKEKRGELGVVPSERQVAALVT